MKTRKQRLYQCYLFIRDARGALITALLTCAILVAKILNSDVGQFLSYVKINSLIAAALVVIILLIDGFKVQYSFTSKPLPMKAGWVATAIALGILCCPSLLFFMCLSSADIYRKDSFHLSERTKRYFNTEGYKLTEVVWGYSLNIKLHKPLQYKVL
ncbi:MAG: hypothetical protein V4478_04005 [Patescibacteria group bacterium]